MIVIPDLFKSRVKLDGSVVTIGVFDALHIGHKELIKKLKIFKKRTGLKSVLVTFDPYPREILGNLTKNERLLTRREKLDLLEGEKIDVVAFIKFTKTVAKTEPDDFVKKFLVKKLGMKSLIIGEDFSLGKNKTGSLKLLRELGRIFKFRLTVIRTLLSGIHAVKSSLIRELLQNGEVEEASKLLGRYYSLEGRIEKGMARGRRLGFKTANIEIPEKLIPKEGIYATFAYPDREKFGSITYVGNRPTFKNQKFAIETYIFGIKKQLYGKHLTLEFVKKLRDDKKFRNAAELKAQITKDVIRAKKIHCQQH